MTVGRFAPYATDSPERARVAFYIAAIAVAIGLGIHAVLDGRQIFVPWYVDIPSPVVIYGVLWAAFDKILWRWSVLRALGIVLVPNLSGEYSGIIISSHDRDEEQHECTFYVNQSWTSILIRGEFDKSRSLSQIAGISVLDVDRPRLTYEYINEPKEGAASTMHVHPGTVWFDIKTGADGIRLDGEYYTGRDRRTSGTISIQRVRKV